jgi:hypothetical protein
VNRMECYHPIMRLTSTTEKRSIQQTQVTEALCPVTKHMDIKTHAYAVVLRPKCHPLRNESCSLTVKSDGGCLLLLVVEVLAINQLHRAAYVLNDACRVVPSHTDAKGVVIGTHQALQSPDGRGGGDRLNPAIGHHPFRVNVPPLWLTQGDHDESQNQ